MNEKEYELQHHQKSLQKTIAPLTEPISGFGRKLDVLAGMATMCVVFDSAGRCIYVNPHTIKELGYSEQELLADGFLNNVEYEITDGFLKNIDVETALRFIASDISDDSEFLQKFTLKITTNQSKILYLRVHPSRGLNHSIILSAFDITDILQSHEQLSISMEQQKQLSSELQAKSDILDQTTSICFVFNAGGECIYVNPYTTKLLGIQPHDILGDNFWKKIHYKAIEISYPPMNKDETISVLSGDKYADTRPHVIQYSIDNRNVRYAQIQQCIGRGNILIHSGFDITEQILTKQRLQEEILYKELLADELKIKSEILEKSTAVCVVFDNKGDCIYINPYTEQLFERELQTLLGVGIWKNVNYIGLSGDLGSKQDVADVFIGKQQLDTQPFIMKIITPSNNIRFIQMQRSFGQNNTLIQSGFDITDQVIAKQHLEILHKKLSDSFEKERSLSSELHFKSDILDQTTSICTVFDKDGDCVYINPYTLQLLKITPSEGLNNGFWERISFEVEEGDADDYPTTREAVVHMISNPKEEGLRARVVRYTRDRNITHNFAQLYNSTDRNGEYVIYSGSDITEQMLAKQKSQDEAELRKQMAEQLKAKSVELHFKSDILEQTTSICFVFNRHKQCIYMNPYTMELIELTEDEIIGTFFLEKIEYEILANESVDTKNAAKSAITFENGVSSTPNIGDNRYIIKYFTHNNRKPKYAQLQSIQAANNITIYSGFDITDQILAKQHLELISEELAKSLNKEKELNELKTKFISMIAHEYRDPLTSIMSITEVALESLKKNDPNKATRFLPIIIKSVINMTDIIDDALIIAKEEMNQRLSFEYTDLVTAIKDNMHAASKTYLHCSAKLTTNEEVIEFYSDERLLNYVLKNLITNAMKYTVDGKDVEISIKTDKDNVVIAIKDYGIGIPPADMKFLFSAFFRARNIGKIIGSGLGLYITKSSVDKLQGTISTESEEGIGTTFYVTFPKDPRKLIAKGK